MKIIRIIPNALTSLRIAGAIALFFVEPLTGIFFWIYTICGISDVLDGTIARCAKCSTDFGATLDSISDMIFYAVMLSRILPIILERLSIGIWCAVGIILAVRICSYIAGALKYHKFSSMHTYLNKLTGFSVFLLPYTINFAFFIPFCVFLCAVAFAASLEELIIHLTGSSYTPERKSIFSNQTTTR